MEVFKIADKERTLIGSGFIEIGKTFKGLFRDCFNMDEPPIFPITDTSKALYALMNTTGIGIICVLLRIACFGSSIVSPMRVSELGIEFVFKFF